MARQMYFVDWRDPSFPQVRPIEDGSSYAEPVTLTEAKKEIIDHFRAIIDHARNQTLIARELRAVDVERSEEF